MLESHSESDFRSDPDGVMLCLLYDELVSTSCLLACCKSESELELLDVIFEAGGKFLTDDL